jgi:hypothetical protein
LTSQHRTGAQTSCDDARRFDIATAGIKIKKDALMKHGQKIYLAGAYHDDRLSDYMKRLESLPNVVITHKWTESRDLPLAQAAKADLQGVVDCDLFCAVMDLHAHDYRGTFFEMGAALALGKPVLVVHGTSEQYAQTSCFFWHPAIFRVSTFDKMAHIVKARWQRGSSNDKKLMLLGDCLNVEGISDTPTSQEVDLTIWSDTSHTLHKPDASSIDIVVENNDQLTHLYNLLTY